MKVFFHRQEYKQTIYLNLDLNESSIYKILSDVFFKDLYTVEFEFGVAKVHPSDNYIKSVGRSISEKNRKQSFFKVKQINVKEDAFYIACNNDVIGNFLIKFNRKNNKIIVLDLNHE